MDLTTRTRIERCLKRLETLRYDMRGDGTENTLYTSDLLQAILDLRQVLE